MKRQFWDALKFLRSVEPSFQLKGLPNRFKIIRKSLVTIEGRVFNDYANFVALLKSKNHDAVRNSSLKCGCSPVVYPFNLKTVTFEI